MHDFTKEALRSCAILCLFFAIMVAIHGSQRIRDRAAYLEGRHELSWKQAIRIALDEELGK